MRLLVLGQCCVDFAFSLLNLGQRAGKQIVTFRGQDDAVLTAVARIGVTANQTALLESLIVGRERLYLSWFYRKFGYNPAAFTEADLDEYVRWYSEVGAARSALQYYRNGEQDFAHNIDNKKQPLEMPVLAVGGEHSLGGMVELSLREFAADVRGGVIKDAGHWLAEEQPEELTRQLLEFLG